VIKKMSDGKKVKYDVRFFGFPYERANIEETNIKPIETPVNKLNLKRTAKLNAALGELATHMELLKEPFSIPAKSLSQSKPVSVSPPKKRLKVKF
jgi:hypothetical protein